MTCQDKVAYVDEGVSRVLTEYRESPNLLHMIATYVGKIWEARNSICDLPDYFDIDTAVGDQLTIIGKWMGFPRCHCVCDTQPVFGFWCAGLEQTIVGFCDDTSTWGDCDSDGVSEICITDDEMYRKLLKCRSYQMDSLYGFNDLTTCLQILYGVTAKILDMGLGRVVLTPGRLLTDAEVALLQIVPRVLPIAPGIASRWHFGVDPLFGFGEGWGGFCEEWRPDGLPVLLSDGTPALTEDGVPLMTGPLTRDADWMCEIDLKPYSC